MKKMLALLVLLPVLGYTQTLSADDLPEMCAAAYILAAEEEKLLRWKAMFSLRSDVLREYLLLLHRYREEEDLPIDLLKEAIAECDALYEATSQASVVDGVS